jgi:hypothetical protein
MNIVTEVAKTNKPLDKSAPLGEGYEEKGNELFDGQHKEWHHDANDLWSMEQT